MLGQVIETEVKGFRGALLWLGLKTLGLTLVTFGLYSFWARTRVRRWIWSSVRPDGVPLEYTGQPLEKLIGFFSAAVFVAFYVGLAVMVFMFIGLQMGGRIEIGAGMALLFLTPLYFVAQYRGRRYLLNHTSWRGINFWMEPGAWGYMWRALLWHGLTLLSLGLFAPLKTYVLSTYMINRTYYGDKMFRQTDGAFLLYRVSLVFLISLWSTIGLGIYAFETGRTGLLAISGPIMGISWLYYRVAGARLIYSGVVFDDRARCDLSPRTGRVFAIFLKGHLLRFFILLFFIIGISGLSFALMSNAVDPTSSTPDPAQILEQASVPLFLFAGLFYVTFFMVGAQLKLALIKFPLIAHALGTLVVHDTDHVYQVRQGEDRHMHDADGLAAIFDFGGGV